MASGSPAPHELQEKLANQWLGIEKRTERRRARDGTPQRRTPPFFTRRTPDPIDGNFSNVSNSNNNVNGGALRNVASNKKRFGVGGGITPKEFLDGARAAAGVAVVGNTEKSALALASAAPPGLPPRSPAVARARPWSRSAATLSRASSRGSMRSSLGSSSMSSRAASSLRSFASSASSSLRPVQKTCHQCGVDFGEAGPEVTARADNRMVPFCTARCHRIWCDASTCRGCGRTVPNGFVVKVRTSTPLPGPGIGAAAGAGAGRVVTKATGGGPGAIGDPLTRITGYCSADCAQKSRGLDRPRVEVEGDPVVTHRGLRTNAEARARTSVNQSLRLRLTKSQVPLAPLPPESRGSSIQEVGGRSPRSGGGFLATTAVPIGEGVLRKQQTERLQRGKKAQKQLKANTRKPRRQQQQQQQQQQQSGAEHRSKKAEEEKEEEHGGSAQQAAKTVVSEAPKSTPAQAPTIASLAAAANNNNNSNNNDDDDGDGRVTGSKPRGAWPQALARGRLASAASSGPSFASFQGYVPIASRITASRSASRGNGNTGGSVAGSIAAVRSSIAARDVAASTLPPTPPSVLENQHRPLERLVNPLDSIGRPVPGGKRPHSVASAGSDPFRVTKRFHRTKDDLTEHTETVQRLDRLMKEAEDIGRKRLATGGGRSQR